MYSADLVNDAVYNNKQKRLILDEEGFLDDEAVYRYCELAKMTNPRGNPRGCSSLKASVC